MLVFNNDPEKKIIKKACHLAVISKKHVENCNKLQKVEQTSPIGWIPDPGDMIGLDDWNFRFSKPEFVENHRLTNDIAGIRDSANDFSFLCFGEELVSWWYKRRKFFYVDSFSVYILIWKHVWTW